MIKKIKKVIGDKKTERLIKKYETRIDDLTKINQELTAKFAESQITIGQWQNKLYHAQSQHDALRVATAAMLEPFKNLLRQEAGLFQAANQVWVDRFNEIEKAMLNHEQVREEMKLYDQQYMEVLKRIDRLENQKENHDESI